MKNSLFEFEKLYFLTFNRLKQLQPFEIYLKYFNLYLIV